MLITSITDNVWLYHSLKKVYLFIKNGNHRERWKISIKTFILYEAKQSKKKMEGRSTASRLFTDYWMHTWFKTSEHLNSFFFPSVPSLLAPLPILFTRTLDLILSWLCSCMLNFLLQFSYIQTHFLDSMSSYSSFIPLFWLKYTL